MAEEAASTKTAAERGAELLKEGNKWIARIRAAEKREQDWTDDAEAAEKAFACDTKADKGKLYAFNILHSNVETIVPAIYNSTPIPDVRSRRTLPKVPKPQPPQPPQQQQGQPQDPAAMMQMQQQMAQFQAQMQAYQQAEAQKKAARDFATLIERSITVQIDDNKLDTEAEACARDSYLAGRGIVRLRFFADDDGRNERLEYEAVSWRDYRHGPAKRWADRPWEAYRLCISREEMERLGDSEMMDAQGRTATDEAMLSDDDEDDIVIWEIWCKEPQRYVKFVRESDGKILKQVDDPLGLTGFFPIPTPVQPISITGKLMPVCPFTVYRKLADELDLCTKRINAIMSGLKVRGGVAGDAADIAAIAQADDNELVPISNVEGLAATKGLEGAILWWPVDKAIIVLKELYTQREQIKASIYEITGISDIVRGASNANETATAQQIKTQWGSLRIQKAQRLIQRMIRDLFIMSAEIITTKFSPETLQKMTGIEITPELAAMMQDRSIAYYRVDIESDSTVKADTTTAKQEMGDFMAGTGQYFSTMAPLVQTDPQLAAPVAEIFRSFTRVFNLGKSAEDALDEMIEMSKAAGQQPRPNPEAEKLKGEMEIRKAELQMDMQRLQAEMQAKQQDAQMKAAGEAGKLQAAERKAGIDLQAAMIGLEIKRLELELKKQEAGMKIAAKQAETGLKLDAQRQAGEIKMQQARQTTKEKADAN